jgi:hypothetical protein
MRAAYRGFAYLISLLVVLQAAAIGYAWFRVYADVDDGGVFDKNAQNVGHAFHNFVGSSIVPLVGLLFLIVSFFARIPGGIKWAAITFGLIVLQVLLAYAAYALPLLGVLHGANALAVLAVSVVAASRVARMAPADAAA